MRIRLPRDQQAVCGGSVGVRGQRNGVADEGQAQQFGEHGGRYAGVGVLRLLAAQDRVERFRAYMIRKNLRTGLSDRRFFALPDVQVYARGCTHGQRLAQRFPGFRRACQQRMHFSAVSFGKGDGAFRRRGVERIQRHASRTRIYPTVLDAQRRRRVRHMFYANNKLHICYLLWNETMNDANPFVFVL